MKIITIPENEYFQMQQTIDHLQQQLRWLQYQLQSYPTEQQVDLPSCCSNQPISIKRGSATAIITYLAEDFTAPLPDFQDYTS